jgi:nitrogen-specific signal transduction histidine kinase
VSNQIKFRRTQEALDRAAAERLAVSSDHLAAIMDSTTDGILEIRRDWTILYGNRNAVQSMPDFELGKDFWTCFPDLLGTPMEQHLRNAMIQRIKADYEHFYARHGRWFQGYVFPTNQGISVFFSDITSEKVLKDKLAVEKLLREQRIETVCHMAGGLAHEISNPLAIIHGHANNLKTLAQEGTISPSDVFNGCDSIVKTSERAMRILHGLRGFAFEGKQDPMELASVEAIIQQSIEMQRGRFEQHNIEVRLAIQSELPPLFCRETQIEQILTNLLTNAFDAIAETGSEERWVSVVAELSGSDIAIEVIDNGSGIEEAIKAHVMDPFFSTKKEGLGMGIGLSLSSVIAQEHGGSLTLCQETQNTCFRLTLPVDQVGVSSWGVAANSG